MLVLLFLKNFISPAFTPNSFYFGFLFGIPAGFFEEIGCTGYAFPKMRLKQNFVQAGVTLGLFWGLWHLPVTDFLGAASPHGKYLFLFFLAFTGILTAMRVLIARVYSNTSSILSAQFMHAVSNGCLAILCSIIMDYRFNYCYPEVQKRSRGTTAISPKIEMMVYNYILILVHFQQQVNDQSRPPGLVRGAQALPGVPMEIL